MDNKVRIAIFNGDVDILISLKDALEGEGYQCKIGLETEVKSGKFKIQTFMDDFCPSLIIWDIMPPYDASMAFLKGIREGLGLREMCVILTSTNARIVTENMVEGRLIYQLHKPFDIEEMLGTIKTRLRLCGPYMEKT